MEIKQLETFVCVAKNLSFSKAAEKLFISQPTVSANINALETFLGVQLFIRSTKEVSLTKTGKSFLVYAQQILSLREEAMYSINGEDRNTQAHIDIVSSTIPAQHLLPKIIPSFQKEWPNIFFSVDQTDSIMVEQKMCGFRYDFGMIGTVPDSNRFVHYPVFDDELVLAIPKNAPESPEMIRRNFADYIQQKPFIMRESGSGTRKEIEILLSKIGVNPNNLRVSACFSDAHSILLAVSGGMGVSLISKVATAMYAETGMIDAVGMNNQLYCRKIYLLHNKELRLSPVQKAFVDRARRYYQK